MSIQTTDTELTRSNTVIEIIEKASSWGIKSLEWWRKTNNVLIQGGSQPYTVGEFAELITRLRDARFFKCDDDGIWHIED
jgi:hypothetical protein